MIQRGVITEDEARTVRWLGRQRYSAAAIAKVWYATQSRQAISRVGYLLRREEVSLRQARNDFHDAWALLQRVMKHESRIAAARGWRRRGAA